MSIFDYDLFIITNGCGRFCSDPALPHRKADGRPDRRQCNHSSKPD